MTISKDKTSNKAPQNATFLKDVFWLSLNSFGGPQVHLLLFVKLLVQKRGYITNEQLLEYNALAQLLPGPSSTQTLAAIAYHIGGTRLAFISLAIWILPGIVGISAFGWAMLYLEKGKSLITFLQFLPALSVALIASASFNLSKTMLTNVGDYLLAAIVVFLAYFFPSPWFSPIYLVGCGLIYASPYWNWKQIFFTKPRFNIPWKYFQISIGLFIFVAILGQLTASLPIRLFENFYRNGALIFGGGNVLLPLMYSEFVEFKGYLKSAEFLSGVAVIQILPGPVFAFTSYIGLLSMRFHSFGWQLVGALIGSAIFLPGILLLFFVIKFWKHIQHNKLIIYGLRGINVGAAGLMVGTTAMLLTNIDWRLTSIIAFIICGAILQFTKVPTYILVFGMVLLGVLLG